MGWASALHHPCKDQGSRLTPWILVCAPTLLVYKYCTQPMSLNDRFTRLRREVILRTTDYDFLAIDFAEEGERATFRYIWIMMPYMILLLQAPVSPRNSPT